MHDLMKMVPTPAHALLLLALTAITASAATVSVGGYTFSSGFIKTQMYSDSACSAASLYYVQELDLQECVPSGAPGTYMRKMINLGSCTEFVHLYYSSSDCSGQHKSTSGPSNIKSMQTPTETGVEYINFGGCTGSPSGASSYVQACSADPLPSSDVMGAKVQYFIETEYDTLDQGCSASRKSTFYYAANKCFYNGRESFEIVQDESNMVVKYFERSHACSGASTAILLYGRQEACGQYSAFNAGLQYFVQETPAPSLRPVDPNFPLPAEGGEGGEGTPLDTSHLITVTHSVQGVSINEFNQKPAVSEQVVKSAIVAGLPVPQDHIIGFSVQGSRAPHSVRGRRLTLGLPGSVLVNSDSLANSSSSSALYSAHEDHDHAGVEMQQESILLVYQVVVPLKLDGTPMTKELHKAIQSYIFGTEFADTLCRLAEEAELSDSFCGTTSVLRLVSEETRTTSTGDDSTVFTYMPSLSIGLISAGVTLFLTVFALITFYLHRAYKQEMEEQRKEEEARAKGGAGMVAGMTSPNGRRLDESELGCSTVQDIYPTNSSEVSFTVDKKMMASIDNFIEVSSKSVDFGRKEGGRDVYKDLVLMTNNSSRSFEINGRDQDKVYHDMHSMDVTEI